MLDIIDAPATLWTPETVKHAYVLALVTIEDTTREDRPRLSRSSGHHLYDADDIKAQGERYDKNRELMPKHNPKSRRRYTAKEIEWASFVLCGGSYHGSGKVDPWLAGILSESVVRTSFEAWGKQMADRRLGREKRAMSEICADVGVSLATFNRYVTGGGEQIAKALNVASVDLW